MLDHAEREFIAKIQGACEYCAKSMTDDEAMEIADSVRGKGARVLHVLMDDYHVVMSPVWAYLSEYAAESGY